MSDTLPQLDHTPVRHEQQRPRGPLPYLAALASICLPVTAVMLPWIRWTLVYHSASAAVTYSMWSLVGQGIATDMGAAWMLIVAVGMATAFVGTVVELVMRPVHLAPRWIALGGFGVTVAGLSLGLIVSVGGYSSSAGVNAYLSSTAFASSLDAGFWLAIVVALVGAAVSLGHIASPPNEPPAHLPFAPSPLGPPPGLLPPGFYPPSDSGWSEYAERGRIPPGYVPPNYGPAVEPMPGFITPAYMKRDFPSLDWESISEAPEVEGAISIGSNGDGDGNGKGPAAASAARPDLSVGKAAGAGATDGSTEGSATVQSAPRAKLGRMVVEEGGKRTVRTVMPGERLIVGRDVEAEIRVRDPKVSERHAAIEWRGELWAVQDIDALNPTRLVDALGLHRLVRGETEIEAGQLAVGDVTITLYPMR